MRYDETLWHVPPCLAMCDGTPYFLPVGFPTEHHRMSYGMPRVRRIFYGSVMANVALFVAYAVEHPMGLG